MKTRRFFFLATVFFCFLAAPADFARAEVVTNRQVIRSQTEGLELGGKTYTVTYTNTSGTEPYGAALLLNQVELDSLNDAVFINNVLNSQSTNKQPLGSAVAITGSTVGEIKNTQFIGNVMNSSYTGYHLQPASGALIFGSTLSAPEPSSVLLMDNVLFRENRITGGSSVAGGALAVENAEIETLRNSTFEGNFVSTTYDGGIAQGGAILLLGNIGTMESSVFSKNYAKAASGYAVGGAISAQSKFPDTARIIRKTDFLDNQALSEGSFAYGGAIASMSKFSEITDVRFNGNKAEGESAAGGGALYSTGEIELIDRTEFSNNSSIAHQGGGNGGALTSSADIRQIRNSVFSGNSVEGETSAYGGAIYITGGSLKLVDNVSFTNNSVVSAASSAAGGAIFNYSAAGKIRNSSFSGNKAKGNNAYGGAIYTRADLTLEADNYDFSFSGNTAESKENGVRYNALHAAGAATVTLEMLNNGRFIFDDGISGSSGYGLILKSDKAPDTAGRTTQYVKLNNSLTNAGNIDIINTTLSFGKGPFGRGEITADGDPLTKASLQNAAFDLYNGYRDTVNLAGWNAADSYLHIDVDTDALTADMLNITGDVTGTTKLIVYAGSVADITGKYIPFATATGAGKANSFSVYRVYNSPYMYDIAFDRETDGSNHVWELTMNDEKENEYAGILPDPLGTEEKSPDTPTAPVYGEVVAYGALPAAALEQTRNMVDNIGNQIKNGRVYTRSCSFVDGYWNGEPYYNLWVNPTYYTSNIDSPFAIDADIWGIEAGGDIQHDIHNRLGIFVSYRQGEYDMSGNGDKYRSPVGSEIDIDSYLAGLYYRYDHNNWYAFATLYGGIQEADIKTDDGMKSDTDGVEFGASAEVGYDYALTDSVTLTPELGVFYTQVNYDDAEDNVGKSASYDDARQIELEAGVKLAKTFMTDESFANVYVKPSVVQTIVDGDEVNITGLGDVEALDDATLGRIEIGGRYGFTTNLSAYGWANYTFGSDYDATTFGLGLNYAF